MRGKTKARVVGRISWNPRGYAFVDARGLDEGVFVPLEAMNGALPGDLVEVSAWRDRKGLRGKVISIVERTRLSVTGRYVRHRKYGVLEPLQPMPYPIVIPLGFEGDASHNDMVSVTVLPGRHRR